VVRIISREWLAWIARGPAPGQRINIGLHCLQLFLKALDVLAYGLDDGANVRGAIGRVIRGAVRAGVRGDVDRTARTASTSRDPAAGSVETRTLALVSPFYPGTVLMAADSRYATALHNP
jgi:hypothetical protein